MAAAVLPEALVHALGRLALTANLLVALDFDGTLAPTVDDPERARALPEARAAVLALLAAPATRVALVSGRALASLEAASDLPETALLVGSHGSELRLDDSQTRLGLDPGERGRLGLLHEILRGVADSTDQVWLESKPVGFALHTRLASERNSRIAQQRALSRTARIGDLTVRHGNNVLEFSVRSATKGEAIEQLREHAAATAIFFAGDDATDEDGFAALRLEDVGLKSGSGPTLAGFRVPGPPEVALALHLLADLRTRR